MSSKEKGKALAVYGKRKLTAGNGSRRRPKKPAVLQFFEDAAEVDYDQETDGSDFDDAFLTTDGPELRKKNETGKASNQPFIPKEDQLTEEQFDKMMEDRYTEGAELAKYATDYEDNISTEQNSITSAIKIPTLWKVKCMVGREKHSVFCLMQKFVHLQSLGNKLQILSAFAVDHVRGFIYIEAYKECDLNEACKGLAGFNCHQKVPVPRNKVSLLLAVQSTHNKVFESMWARVKNGKYKGDLAQVVAVNDMRKRATVKLIPRIDLQSLARKFGVGVPVKETARPRPRLISSSELEEFRPLIQYRCDRDTGKHFEVLDGLMLKDGFLYKKVPLDSLSYWCVMPSEEELLNFQHLENGESSDLEWLSELYHERKRKKTLEISEETEKGEGSSSPSRENRFELYSLVCFRRTDFGLIVDKNKDGHYKILKQASEGSLLVTVEQHEIKSGLLDLKFTALDHHKKVLSINDLVKVLEGPSEGKQGTVKQIYRGIIFLHDANETENGGYFCCKSEICEKMKIFEDVSSEKGGVPEGASSFGNFPSAKSSPAEKPWHAGGLRNDLKRDKDGLFSIGQTFRIRVGPLKGYICHVLAVHHSDVTVKLASQQKILTVKNEHLSEVRSKSIVIPKSEDKISSSFKRFDLLGTEGSKKDIYDGGLVPKWIQSNEGGRTQDFTWGKRSSWDSRSIDSKDGPGTGGFFNKNSNMVPCWVRKDKWESEPSNNNRNQDSDWVKKSTWKSGTEEANKDYSWAKQSCWNSNSSYAGGKQEPGWVKKRNWNSRLMDSAICKKGKWKVGTDDTVAELDSTGNKRNYAPSDARGNQDSTWGNKFWGGKQNPFDNGTRNTDARNESRYRKSNSSFGLTNSEQSQHSVWGKKADWNPCSSGNNNRSGFRGRGRSDRGSKRGRGRTNGGFENNGNKRGFGGNGAERGGFGARGGNRGSFRGRGGDRGGYDGRGRGQRDQSGGWNGEFKWNHGGGDNTNNNNSNSVWKGLNLGSNVTNKQAGGFNSQGPNKGKRAGASNNPVGGWKKGEGSSSTNSQGIW